VIASGALIGLNNTLVTTAVMSISRVPRSTASATYGFVRFIGGGLAPYAAAKLAERYNAHVPFLIGAVTVLAGVVVLSTVRDALDAADADEAQPGPSAERDDAIAAVRQVPGLPEEAITAGADLTAEAELAAEAGLPAEAELAAEAGLTGLASPASDRS
jgi:ACDE family multidrug resistance protein